MGEIRYGNDRLRFDDRLLAHLEVVIVQKLRVGESFLMSWINAVSAGSGRTSIWIQPGVAMRFDFEGVRAVEINREWLRVLQRSADGSTGLVVTGEDGRIARCGGPV